MMVPEQIGGVPDGMVTARLRHIVRDVDRHGNVRVYFRYGRRKIRLKEPFGSAEFHARYHELLYHVETGVWLSAVAQDADPLAPAAGTFGWLVRQYLSSADFKALDPATQRTRRGIAGHMLAEPISPDDDTPFRRFPVSRLTTAALIVLRDRKTGLPGASNNRVRVLRAVFKWALAERITTSDPALALKRVRTRPGGHHSWTPAEVDQYIARHVPGTKAHLALMLLFYTGGRRSDVPRLGRQHRNGGRLKWTAWKNRNRFPVTLDIPVLPPLQEALDRGPVGKLLFLETEFGKGFSINGFGAWFRERCDQAGLPQCSAHGVRKAASTLAAENGATPHELMSMFGWTTLAEAERYTKAANRKRLADSGMAKIIRVPGGTKPA